MILQRKFPVIFLQDNSNIQQDCTESVIVKHYTKLSSITCNILKNITGTFH